MKNVLSLIAIMLLSLLSVSLISAGELPPEGPVPPSPPLPCTECPDSLDSFNVVATCDSVTVSYSSSVGNVSQVVGGSDPLGQLFFERYDNTTVSATIPFSTSLQEGDSMFVRVVILDNHEGLPIVIETRFLVVSCEGESSSSSSFIEQCADGRLNANLCEPLAIYPVISDDGVGLTIYEIPRGSDVGVFQLYVDAERLSDLPDTDEVCTIDASADGSVVVYLLPTGEIQVNAGPDDDDKVFVYRFETLSGLPEIETYSASTTPTILPDCS
ncbi:MAG: hypothetical protein ACFE0Q_03290 [Anaerolineae bacterium]